MPLSSSALMNPAEVLESPKLRLGQERRPDLTPPSSARPSVDVWDAFGAGVTLLGFGFCGTGFRHSLKFKVSDSFGDALCMPLVFELSLGSCNLLQSVSVSCGELTLYFFTAGDVTNSFAIKNPYVSRCAWGGTCKSLAFRVWLISQG